MDAMEKIKAVCGEVCAAHLPRWDELPDIELYMDQVIALMGKYMQGFGEDEKLLTSSMVNNYVKMGIVPAPVKKKYSRSHLAHLIIICAMKRVVSMSIIQAFITAGLKELSEQQLLDLTVDYCDVAAAHAAERTMERMNAIEFNGATQLNLLAASCAIRSQLELRMAERIAATLETEKPEKKEK